MSKKTPTSKAPILKIHVAGVRVTPKSGWLVKRASYTAVKSMKICRATATDDNDEGDNDEGDIDEGDIDEGDIDEGDIDEGDIDEGDIDEGDIDDEDDIDDYGDDDIDDYGDDDIDGYGDDDIDDYGDDDMDDYGHDDENYTNDDGDDVIPVAHTSSQGRVQHAATDLRIPRRHSVPHTAPDCLALTTVKQTFDVPHAPTIAKLTASIEVRMSAHMDERIASFEMGYKLVMASLATSNAQAIWRMACMCFAHPFGTVFS
jgi:hypothetical protein